MTTLVDTNVFVDVIAQDAHWMAWSVQALAQARSRGAVLTNWVVYAELHSHNTAGPHIDRILEGLQVSMVDLNARSAQLAAQAFRQYRQQGGTRTGVLPDFFIGAHALALGVPLLTRDAGRYRRYFASIQLICP